MMKIAMLGSMGNINRLVIPQLVQAGHDVTVISTSDQRRAAIEAAGAHAAIGTMTDIDFLSETFTGKDVVYLMLSGSIGTDPFAGAIEQAQIWRQAIENASVKNVVDLSSIGADADEVAGSLHAYNLIEGVLRSLDINIAFVRPTGFYANLFSNLTSIKQDHAIYANIAADLEQKWVAPADIAAVVYPLIAHTPAGITVHYAYSDTFSGADFVTALQQALNMPDLHWVQISDEQYEQGLLTNGVPEKIAASLVQTSHYQRHPEQVYADLLAQQTPAGQVKLADFIRTYVDAFNGKGDHHAHTIAD